MKNHAGYSGIIERADVEVVLGMKYRKAKIYFEGLQKKYKKKEGEFVSVDELSEYSGISVERILKCLGRLPEDDREEKKG